MTVAFNAKLAALTKEAMRTAPYSRSHRVRDPHCHCGQCRHVRAHIATALHAEGGWTWLAIGTAIGVSADTARNATIRAARRRQANSGAAA